MRPILGLISKLLYFYLPNYSTREVVMAACQEVQMWFTDNVLVPVERVITATREACENIGSWVESSVTRPVESWISKTEQQCRDWPWPLSWFCEAVVVLIKVVEWVVETVVKWVVTLVCQIVTFVVGLVVDLVLRLVAWVVSFFVCLFTDPLNALKSIYDLWNIVIDVVREVFGFVGKLLDDVSGILNDFGRLLDSLASSLGWLGVVIGLLKGLVDFVGRLVSIVKDIVASVGDIVTGVLALNPCAMLRGVTDLGVGVGRAVVAVAAPVVGAAAGTAISPGVGTALGGLGVAAAGVRDTVNLKLLEGIATSAINTAFGAGSARASRSIAMLNMNSRAFGLMVRPDARRMFLSSRSTTINLAALHNSGALSLHGLAGYVAGCPKLLNEADAEVVYAGTDVRVSYSDIDTFLKSGPMAVSAFNVFPIKRSKFRAHLDIAKRKARSLGVQFVMGPITDFEATLPAWMPLDASGITLPTQQGMMRTIFGRTGTARDDLSILPTVSHFHYVPNAAGSELFGLTSWFRPSGTVAVPAGNPESIAMASGVTYRNRTPDYVFRWVLIHEMGHYLGLDHIDGTRWLDEIMYSTATGGSVSAGGVFEYLALGGEPRFTSADATAAWAWFTGDGAATLLP